MGEPITLYKPYETITAYGSSQVTALSSLGWSTEYLPTVEQVREMESEDEIEIIPTDKDERERLEDVMDGAGVSDGYIQKMVAAGFDTIEKTQSATYEEISGVRGIGNKTALKIKSIVEGM